jgi:hypothetical protein
VSAKVRVSIEVLLLWIDDPPVGGRFVKDSYNHAPRVKQIQ